MRVSKFKSVICTLAGSILLELRLSTALKSADSEMSAARRGAYSGAGAADSENRGSNAEVGVFASVDSVVFGREGACGLNKVAGAVSTPAPQAFGKSDACVLSATNCVHSATASAYFCSTGVMTMETRSGTEAGQSSLSIHIWKEARRK